MKLGTLAQLLCASVSANYIPARQAATALPSFDASSIAQALGTALPHSLLQAAVTNPAAVASMIAADFGGGRTPDWFFALPTSLQSELLRTGVTLPTAAAPTRTIPPFALPPIVDTTIDPALLSGILYSRISTGTHSSLTSISTASRSPTTSSTTTSSTTTSGTTTSSTTSPTSPTQKITVSSSSPPGASTSAPTMAPSSTGGAMSTAAVGLGISGLLGLAGLLVL